MNCRNLLGVLIALLLIGCSGAMTGARPAAPVTGTVHFAISLPALQASNLATTARSLTITPAHGQKQILDIRPDQVTFAHDASVPAGTNDFTIVLYDQAGGNGQVLAQGTVSVTIVAGQTHDVGITLGGVAARLKLSPQALSLKVGKSSSIFLAVSAWDAAGNVIIGPYSPAIELAISDKTGILKLSSSTLTNSAELVTIAYNGKSIEPVTVNASAGDIKADTTLAPALTVEKITISPATPTVEVGQALQLAASVLLSDGTTEPDVIWGSSDPGTAVIGSTGLVTGVAVGSITITATAKRDNSQALSIPLRVSPPLSSLSNISPAPPSTTPAPAPTPAPTPSASSGSSGILGTYLLPNAPQHIATDPSGNVWIEVNNGSGVIKLSGSGSALGTFSSSDPNGMALDPSGNAWVAQFNGDFTVSKLSPAGSVLGTYPVGKAPFAVKIDSTGNVWVVNYFGNTVSELSPGGSPIGTYSVGSYPKDLAFDSADNAWVTNWGSNNVTKLTSTGGVVGTYTTGTGPFGIAIDGSGNVWIANQTSNDVTKLSSTGSNLGTFSVGTEPFGIAVDSSDNIWVANHGDNYLSKLSPSGSQVSTLNVTDNPAYIVKDVNQDMWVTVQNNGSNINHSVVKFRP